ncbi:HlyD family efflux transporter periplasmic adaptor subunit [Bradyrhizobium sp. 62]|uniref:HlyD family efflux transporter periplasmic adaptor subunit n=1 Tax=Bradyrhizobium sp. 62 TaxID=1043588 RepID=UPI001FFBD530|nr:HlyD family efflux transporter periplasmic adaptor subunit [Bradyrhizobium sp. 62]
MPTPEQVIELQGESTPHSRPDAGPWTVLATARDASEFCQAWLRLQCEQVAGATAALLLLDDGEGHFSSVAGWPDAHQDLSFLAATAQQALSRKSSFIDQTAPPGAMQIGQPIGSHGRLMGVVVVALNRPTADIPVVIRQLRWGIGWLELLFVRQQSTHDSTKLARTGFALGILSEAQQHSAFRASALSIANELASRLDCTNVSVGFLNGKSIKLIAMSHAAVFSEQSQIVSTIENAMEEAADQNASVAFPVTPSTERRIALAHEDLAKRLGGSAVVSVLMTNGLRSAGVILLERDRSKAFDDATIETLEAVAALVGPGLETKSETNKFIAGRAVTAIESSARALLGPGRPAIKLGAIAILALLGTMAFAKGEFRITAKAVVEGAIQRSIVAPFDGYVASAPVRAGDIVEPDQMMATLDDRELKLEAARWKSERDQQTLKYSDAMSKHDRSVALVVSASLEQTAAQLSLVEDKLARAAITAPFRGVVVSGDLRQLIGSPVEKGKVLFEIAPLESFRVILQVDERDIAFLSEGQQGTLVLTGLSSDAVPFNVKVITPVATASEGHNQFRVEAAVQGVAPLLRPGMEGIGKISIDRRSLLAIWTRSLIDWIHITAWKWLP